MDINQMVSTEITLILFFTARDGEALYSQKKKKKRLDADYGSDLELFIEKFRLKLNKVGKTTRLFRYDRNQIPYDYLPEVTNRFKGLDMIECQENIDEGSYHCTRGSDQDHPQEKEM